jgi:hypothetical protein
VEDLRQLLDRATAEQRLPLVKLIDSNFCKFESTEQIIRGVGWLHRNMVDDLHREIFSAKSECYADVLATLLARIGVKASSKIGCKALEQLIVQRYVWLMWAELNAEQQNNFDSVIETLFSVNGKGAEWIHIGGLAGMLAAGNVSGIGVYLLASSALSTTSTFFGISLPFAIYKSVSTAINLALGPVGWIALGVFACLKLSGPNYRKLLPLAFYVALLRQELELSPNVMYGGALVSPGHDRGMRLL